MKKFINRILNPRPWGIIIVFLTFAAVLAGTLCFLVFVESGSKYEFVGYILYGLSAIMLIYAVYCFIKLIPPIKSSLKGWVFKREFTRKIVEHYGFRTVVFAVVSLVISLANAAINLTLGIVWVSVWYIALGVYYLFLSTMRGGVLIYHRRKNNYLTDYEEKSKSCITYMVCGVWLILLPVALSIVIMEIVGSGMAFVHAGLLIYVAAAYTFYKIITSVYNFVKAHKGDEMSIRAIRNVNLADALVSVFALQTAMFHEFAGGANPGYANAIFGAILCAATAAIGIFMIVNGKKKLKLLKTHNEEEQEN